MGSATPLDVTGGCSGSSPGAHPDYLVEYTAAPANCKDIFEGTVNVHWKAGVNALTKQLGSPSGPYLDYYWHHLDVNGTPITDWAHNEQQDYTGGHGVYDATTDPAQSLYLSSIQ